MPDEVPEEGGLRENPWNSLEIMKLVVSAATPFVIAAIGFSISASSEDRARIDRALDRRLEIWNVVGPKVRKMRDQTALIYMMTAPKLPVSQRADTIGAKGVYNLMLEVDEVLEVRPFFSPTVMQEYIDFSTCANELTQAIDFNQRKNIVRISEARLAKLWGRTDLTYNALIDRVRKELSGAVPDDDTMSYPRRPSGGSHRDASLCLDGQAVAKGL